MKERLVSIVGGGNMGAAFARAFARRNIYPPERIHVLESMEARRSELAAEGFDVAAPSDREPLARAIMLAIKPQDFQSCVPSLRAAMPERALIISIMAGVASGEIASAFGPSRSVARAMPNIAVQTGHGVTAYYGSALEEAEVAEAERLLGSVGICLRVANEDLIDAVTAVSGSGPAYVYYFMEAMLEGASRLGLDAAQAAALVKGTFEGAISLLATGDASPADLRGRVTSKGGTTEAALTLMEEKGVGAAISAAVERAYARAKELAALSKKMHGES